MSNLPIEIAEQFLLKLPARSLIRLSLVCKQWRSLIYDPNFVKDHSNIVLLDQSQRHLRLITMDYLNGAMISRSIDCQSINSTNLKFKSENHMNLISSCNGLWLIEISRNVLVLWNPFRSENYKVLPKSNITSSKYNIRFDGFGYAPSIDDYKVVGLHENICHSHCYSKLQVQVYSLKTNSWKVIPGVSQTNLTFNNYRTDMVGTYVNGSIYWLIYDSSNVCVLAFDLITEKFKIIDAPSLYDENVYSYPLVLASMLQVRGCLGAYWSSCDNNKDTVIWIWNEEEDKKGGGGYWTKFLTIPKIYSRCNKVISFLNDNQFLLHVVDHTGLDKMIIYDLACMVLRDIPRLTDDEGPMYHMLETLVSPLSY